MHLQTHHTGEKPGVKKDRQFFGDLKVPFVVIKLPEVSAIGADKNEMEF